MYVLSTTHQSHIPWKLIVHSWCTGNEEDNVALLKTWTIYRENILSRAMLAYLVQYSTFSFKWKGCPILSSLFNFLFCYLNVYSPVSDINSDDVTISNKTNWITILKKISNSGALITKGWHDAVSPSGYANLSLFHVETLDFEYFNLNAK